MKQHILSEYFLFVTLMTLKTRLLTSLIDNVGFIELVLPIDASTVPLCEANAIAEQALDDTITTNTLNSLFNLTASPLSPTLY